ncbi:hypothetical protein J6P92_08315 [bacterium]|nr:hypothetical protein [bacterium]
MSSKLENVTVMDCNTVANGIMRDIIGVDRMERMLGSKLSSEDLFHIDCAILTSLRNTQDFSRDLLAQLENGMFETVAVRPPKTFETDLETVQREALMDISLPMQSMFEEMAGYVTEAFV